jgi:hypothetical protein
MQILVETQKRIYLSDEYTREEAIADLGSETAYREMIAEVVNFMREFKDLNYVSLTIGGETTFINPAFIHSIRIKGVAQEDMP